MSAGRDVVPEKAQRRRLEAAMPIDIGVEHVSSVCHAPLAAAFLMTIEIPAADEALHHSSVLVRTRSVGHDVTFRNGAIALELNPHLGSAMEGNRLRFLGAGEHLRELPGGTDKEPVIDRPVLMIAAGKQVGVSSIDAFAVASQDVADWVNVSTEGRRLGKEWVST